MLIKQVGIEFRRRRCLRWCYYFLVGAITWPIFGIYPSQICTACSTLNMDSSLLTSSKIAGEKSKWPLSHKMADLLPSSRFITFHFPAPGIRISNPVSIWRAVLSCHPHSQRFSWPSSACAQRWPKTPSFHFYVPVIEVFIYSAQIGAACCL